MYYFIILVLQAQNIELSCYRKWEALEERKVTHGSIKMRVLGVRLYPRVACGFLGKAFFVPPETRVWLEVDHLAGLPFGPSGHAPAMLLCKG